MNTRSIPRLILGLLTAGSTALAQTAPTETSASAPRADDVVELSPFVVNSERDTGYQALSTLAGTRLNTPVEDVGASLSIFTKDFLEDIGATNAQDLLVYATGMEAAGAGGNFSGGTNDINAAQVLGDTVRSNPMGATRTRGLSAPNFTRGFFATEIPFDSYNTESVTVNRGPNAILFGVGSPAGVVDAALARANVNRNSNRVDVRVGDNSSLRQSANFNRVLIPGKLAVRVAGLYEDERYDQRPAFEEKKRVYGAVTYQPTRTTAIRANFESGKTEANRPITVLPFKSISDAWLEGGRPGYDWTFYDDPARNPNAATQVSGNAFWQALFMGQNQLFDQVIQVYGDPTGGTPDFALRSETRTTTGNTANAVRANLFHPTVNRDRANDSLHMLNTLNIAELPANYWVGDRVLPGQLPGFTPAGIKQQAFTDFSAFDFSRRMIDETSRQGNNFHAFNIAIEQRAWQDRIGVEFAYDTQRFDSRTKNSAFSSGNANHIRIDTNVVLPNGQTNPNYGRPFANTYSQANWRNNFTERESRRLTAYLKYDFKDLDKSWGRWLGRHTLTGLYEKSGSTNIAYTHRLAVDGDAARSLNANIGTFARRPGVLVYLGPSMIGNNNELQLQPIQIPVIQAGPLPVPVNYFVRAANATDPGAFVDSPATLVEINNGGNAERDVIKSEAALLQSYWLQEHLVTLVGWRRDSDYFARQNINFVTNPADANDPGKVHWGFEDLTMPGTPPLNVKAETWTYSAVLKWPQRLLRLPAGTQLSAFANKSSNFTPTGGRVNGFGEALASPEGTTEEFGLNLSAFHGKVTLRYNTFTTKVVRQGLTPQVHNVAINNGILQLADTWGIEANINPHLAAARNADIDLLFSPLPANFRELYGWAILGTAPSLSAAGRPSSLSGVSDTSDFTAEGHEMELVVNPTRNWRVLLNVARQESIQTNSLPFTKRLVELMRPVWDQLADRPRSNYPLGWQPGDPVVTQTVGDWVEANVYVPLATATATEGSAAAEQRKWRANLVTNYSFRSGWLKGFGVGGAARWQDKVGIGYPTTRNTDGTVTIHIDRPWFAPAETNYDAWISYERALWRNKVRWKVQLNARNLFGDNDPIAIAAQPWGAVSATRLAPERRWYLTNTFTF